MRNMLNRIRRLEEVKAPYAEEKAAAEAILAARRRRLGPDYLEPIPYPSDWFAGCRSIADEINRARRWNVQCRAAETGSRASQNSFR